MNKIRPMHQSSFKLAQILLRFAAFFFIGYRHKGRYKIKKDDSIIVLSNHQTDIDPLLVNLSFTRLLRPLTTDNVFRKGLIGYVLKKFGGIPKRKGAVDVKSSIELFRAAKNNESIIIFPEGNRTYAEFQYYVSTSLIKMIKMMKKTIVIFNIHGGNGTRPRFKHKVRRGKFYGEIKKVLTYKEYKDIPDEVLLSIIMDNIRVYDSDSGELYKSKRRAEYLERMFFVCPACNSTQSLYSKKELVFCEKCGLEIEYTEDLHLKAKKPGLSMTKLVDWYLYQKMWVKNYNCPKNAPIFWDENVKLFSSEVDQKKVKITSGKMLLTSENLTIGNKIFDLAGIEVASPVSGTKLCFTHNGKSYQVNGHVRFNPLKYMFMFNKLDTKIHQNKIDNYFNLEEEKL